jgi:hypothetical protein
VNLIVGRLLSRMSPRLMMVALRCGMCRYRFHHLYVVPRTVVGYHGYHREFASRLVASRVSLEEWRMSQNDYDWLGHGIYFWEYAPGRAGQWAREHFGEEGAVVATEIRLGRCLDLGDTAFTTLFQESYRGTVELYQRQGWELPKNSGRDEDLKLRKLDRLIIDRLTRATDHEGGVHYQTVRCPFEEGGPAYAGAKIKTQSHIQITVRDRSCFAGRIYPVDPEGG